MCGRMNSPPNNSRNISILERRVSRVDGFRTLREIKERRVLLARLVVKALDRYLYKEQHARTQENFKPNQCQKRAKKNEHCKEEIDCLQKELDS